MELEIEIGHLEARLGREDTSWKASDLGVMNQWPHYRVSLMSLITNINLSGLHPIDAFMRYMNYMRFMKSGKSLAG